MKISREALTQTNWNPHSKRVVLTDYNNPLQIKDLYPESLVLVESDIDFGDDTISVGVGALNQVNPNIYITDKILTPDEERICNHIGCIVCSLQDLFPEYSESNSGKTQESFMCDIEEEDSTPFDDLEDFGDDDDEEA